MPDADRFLTSRRKFVTASSLMAAGCWLRGMPAAEPKRQLGVALVGLGNYAKSQLRPALTETKYCRLAGVVTGSHRKGRAWAHHFGFSPESIYHYDEMERMADDDGIDIVYVVTPNALHAEHSIRAAQAGKHVICEKPFTISLQEADDVIAACREAGVKLSIGYRLHFDPFHQAVKDATVGGDWGAVTASEGAFSFRLHGRPWRAQKSLAGGGPLMDVGVYVIQAACMVMDEVAPEWVEARELPKNRPQDFVDVEETLEWTMGFANGVRCQGRTSYDESANDFHVDCAGGWARLNPAYGYSGIVLETHQGVVDLTPINQQVAQMDDFARCILEDRESMVDGWMGRRDMAIIEAIYRAAASDRRESVAA